jgi:1-acyl-sn-glycerol-3-phosphate acyltransferase
MKIKDYFISLYLWLSVLIIWIILIIIFMIIWISTRWFDSKSIITQKFTAFWASTLFITYPYLRVKVLGKENLIKDKACVYMSNHSSMLDIFLLFKIHSNLIWVSKKENFKAPILGWVMKLNQYISVDRLDPKRLNKMMSNCSKALEKGSPIMIFPEGTRSKTGEILGFRDGGFRVAINNKVPIVPVVMYGAAEVLPKNGFIVPARKTVVKIKVLEPIDVTPFLPDKYDEMKDYTRALMFKEFENIKAL